MDETKKKNKTNRPRISYGSSVCPRIVGQPGTRVPGATISTGLLLLRLLYTRRGPSPVHRCHHFSLFQ